VTVSVLMFCPQFRPIVGGTERQAEKLSKALVRRGMRVTILTPKLDSESLENEEDAGVVILRFSLFDLCRRFPSIPGLGPANLLGLSLQMRRVMLDQIGAHNIVHAHGVSALTVFALSAARKLDKPFLCKIASSGEGFDLKKLSGIGIGGTSLASYLRKNVNAWIATTNSVFQSLIDYKVDRDRILCIPNGVELPRLKTSKNLSKGNRFLYVGRLSSACDRDFDTLYDAFSSLALEYKHIELALVGDGDLFDSIKVKASHSTFSSRLHMPGIEKDPMEWYEWADCFVLPSRKEGMSNSLIEAMSFGLVCIANDIPANREVLEEGKLGYLTTVGSVRELVEIMRRLIKNGVEGIHIGERAAEKVRLEYAMDSIVPKYLTAYNNLIQHKVPS